MICLSYLATTIVFIDTAIVVTVMPCRPGAAKRRWTLIKDHIDRIGRQVAGSIRRLIGLPANDSELTADGKSRKAVGKPQNTLAGEKDPVWGCETTAAG